MSSAVYAGSFDPLTHGHSWLIHEASQLFDKVHVLVSENPSKKCLLSADKRVEIAASVCSDGENVVVHKLPETQFLVRKAQSLGAQVLLRGIRNATDFEYEQTVQNVNKIMVANLTTMYLIPPRHLADVSSSLVKGLMGLDTWTQVVEGLVPKTSFRALIESKLYPEFLAASKPYESQAKKAFPKLMNLYSEPTRHYHNLIHITECMEQLNRVTGNTNAQFSRLCLALIYHDAIYDPTNTRKDEGSNEDMSANLFNEDITDIKEIRDLILVTKTHLPKTDNEKLMCDIDLSILGSNWDRFLEYDDQICKEYAFMQTNMLTRTLFKSKRGSILSSFLKRDKLYHNPEFQDIEANARNNLQKIIELRYS